MSSTPVSQASNPQKQPRVLSCVLCQRRKIKCDRVIPCSNCIKANVTCTPSKPAPPRQRSRPRQDLQDRLARCEKLLRQYVDKPESAPAAGSTSAASAALHQLRPYPSSRSPADGQSPVGTPGMMVSDAGPARFVDGHLWTTLSEEIQVMRDIVDSEEPESSVFNNSEDSFDAFEPNFPSHCSTPHTEEMASPDAVQTFKLWQIFLDRVNPLIKIIHAPTVQPYIVQAAGDMSSIPFSYQGLLHSIFGLATIALSDDELTQLLGTTRERAIKKFTHSASLALVRFDFLRRYDMTVVQALLHTLIILQTEYNRHAAWVLCGSLVRIAISMGYHRDGETLNLPPFETEMRRRIWWQIVTYDIKLTVTCGFKHNAIPSDFNTRQPLNLNDADLFPDSSGELQSREGPTEMGFVLFVHRLTQHLLLEDARLVVESNILGQSSTPDSPVDSQTIERNVLLVQELENDFKDIERRFLSAAAGNAHAVALAFRPHFIAHLYAMLRPIHEQPEWGTEILGPRDNLFKVMVVTSEKMTGGFAWMERWGFWWYMKLHFQPEILASLTSQLYQRPTGTLSDRGWVVIERIFNYHSALFNISTRSNAKLAQFTLKAFAMREQAFAAAGQVLEVPPFIAQLRQNLQPATAATSSLSAMDVEDSISQQPLSYGLDGQPLSQGPFQGPMIAWDFWGGIGGNGEFGNDNQQFSGQF